MALHNLPDFFFDHYQIAEWNHASAILQTDFPNEYNDILNVLFDFRLLRSHIVTPGGNRSPISSSLDTAFYRLGWEERYFHTQQVVDGFIRETPTHSIDCFKNGIGLEIEWNNKDPFYDRDLNNFRLLFDLKTLSVGVIVTRCSHLQNLFEHLDKQNSYGQSTTHMDKLIPRLNGGGAGGCPVLVFGIKDALYVDDI